MRSMKSFFLAKIKKFFFNLSGKSSLAMALLRMIESGNGCIFVDGVDIAKVMDCWQKIL